MKPVAMKSMQFSDETRGVIRVRCIHWLRTCRKVRDVLFRTLAARRRDDLRSVRRAGLTGNRRQRRAFHFGLDGGS